MTGPARARLRLRRTGGIAGVATEAELDTSELESAQAETILRALDAAQGAPPAAPAPPRPDAFAYELEIERGGERRVLRFQDPPPTELAPVLDALSGRSRIAPRERR